MAKLEMKIRELELELGSVQTRTADSYKAFQRAERRVKELQFQQDASHCSMAAASQARYCHFAGSLHESRCRSKKPEDF